MVFVASHLFLFHSVNDGNSRLWEALEATQDVRSAEFKKPVKTCRILSLLSFARSTCHGFPSFSLVFIAFWGSIWQVFLIIACMKMEAERKLVIGSERGMREARVCRSSYLEAF